MGQSRRIGWRLRGGLVVVLLNTVFGSGLSVQSRWSLVDDFPSHYLVAWQFGVVLLTMRRAASQLYGEDLLNSS